MKDIVHTAIAFCLNEGLLRQWTANSYTSDMIKQATFLSNMPAMTGGDGLKGEEGGVEMKIEIRKSVPPSRSEKTKLRNYEITKLDTWPTPGGRVRSLDPKVRQRIFAVCLRHPNGVIPAQAGIQIPTARIPGFPLSLRPT